MSENWSVQVSVKTPAGTLVNLRGDNSQQVEAELDWVIGHADKIVQAEQAFAGVATVAAAAGGQVVSQQSQPWSQQGSQQSQQPAAPQGGGKQCVHGAMVQRSGTSAKGPWSGYFCPLPKERKSEQCQPVFGR